MKKISLNSKRKVNKLKLVLIGLGLILFGALVIFLLIQIDKFFDEKTLKFQAPIQVKIQKPILVEKREEKIEYIVQYAENLPQPETPLEKYICDKFGVADCKIAIAVAKAESGMREWAFNINENGTIDIGIFQINQIHWTKEGCSPKELFDAHKNVDCAYKIWKESGWNAWTAFKNGAFLLKVK